MQFRVLRFLVFWRDWPALASIVGQSTVKWADASSRELVIGIKSTACLFDFFVTTIKVFTTASKIPCDVGFAGASGDRTTYSARVAQ